MKIAWVSHRDYQGLGGAESSDRAMISRRPESVEVTWISPGGVGEGFADFDEVVLSGLWGFSPHEFGVIARAHPVFWVHDTQFSGNWIYHEARQLICLTEGHAEYEIEKNPLLKREQILINPGWFDVTECKSQGNDVPRALWAHRPEAHKGLDLAAEWAEENGIPLDVMVNRPRSEVLDAMGRYEHFVLLSHIFDPGPRAVMEAQLSGCHVVVNEEVGCFDDADDLRVTVDTADKFFWETVLNG